MPIPVVVVDDEETDRLIAHKRVARSQWADVLTPILESSSGDAFLDGVFQSDSLPPGQKLILMDINMPDEETGEMVGVVMEMNVEQTVGYELIEADVPSA